MSRNIKKLTCWHVKVVVILVIKIYLFLPFHKFVFFYFLRKWKNEPHLKIVVASVAFLVCVLYRSLKLQHRLKFCFTCQFFTKDTIEITNDINISYFQSELNIFVISKFRFKIYNDNADINQNPGPFNNPQMFKQEEWKAFSNRELHLTHLNINSLLHKIKGT